MQTSRTFRTAWSALAALAAALPAQAAFTQLTDPSQLGFATVYTVPDGGAGMTQAGPLAVIGGGNTATFSTGGDGSLLLYDSTGQNTAFADNTALLETINGTTGAPTGPLTINFSQGVAAFGLFGQGGASTGTTTFNVSAFDGANPLGTFSSGPLDDDTDPGTSAFLGGAASGGDTITRVTISSQSTEIGTGDNAIYGPLTTGTAVPEPSSLALVGMGLLGLPLLARRMRRNK